jgi:hypothetical protein
VDFDSEAGFSNVNTIEDLRRLEAG